MNTKKRQKTVVVGMSGGVDSSLTAALLVEQGYVVIGVYMKNWSEPIKGVEHCPWVEDQLDARRVAEQLNIPFYTVNFEDLYKRQVIDSFFAEYQKGRTPNPDVLCNRFIKFDAFLAYATSLGADFIATGHYARVEDGNLYKGYDPRKDQSYFLWAIRPNVLPLVLFPLGGFTKHEVRKLAAEKGLVTAQKKDSQGICFIGQADVRQFLAQHIQPTSGPVYDSQGNYLGSHTGAWFYTIGQRVGIDNINWHDNTNRPILYVVATDVRTNSVIVGEDHELYASRLEADSLIWQVSPPACGDMLNAKIRYGQSNTPCVIVSYKNDGCVVAFSTPQRAITPGQSIVFYDGDRVVGGGIIKRAIKTHSLRIDLKETRAKSGSVLR